MSIAFFSFHFPFHLIPLFKCLSIKANQIKCPAKFYCYGNDGNKTHRCASNTFQWKTASSLRIVSPCRASPRFCIWDKNFANSIRVKIIAFQYTYTLLKKTPIRGQYAIDPFRLGLTNSRAKISNPIDKTPKIRQSALILALIKPIGHGGIYLKRTPKILDPTDKEILHFFFWKSRCHTKRRAGADPQNTTKCSDLSTN